jgi:hypothetical protein
MPHPIKMKIKLHVIICLVSAVGKATVLVMCFTRTGRSSTTGKTLFFFTLEQSLVQKTSLTGVFIYIHEYEIEYFITLRSKTTKRK